MSNATQGYPPIDLLNSAEIKIESLSLLANTETSYPLVNNLNQLIIKSRQITSLKISFIMGDIASGDYWSIPRGCTCTITDIDFNGKILYMEAPIGCDVEIKQLYT